MTEAKVVRPDEVDADAQPPKPGMLWETIKSLVFIFGSAIITIIAVKNSMNPYINKFWGASHDFHGALWNSIYDLFGRNDFLCHMIGTTGSSAGCFILFNAFFLVCDITGRPRWLLKYKVQEGKNEPVDMKRVWSCVRTAAFNLLVTSPVFTLIFYPLTTYCGSYHKGDLPSFERFLLEFIVFGIVEEIGFYYSHRLLHQPRFYAKYHKKHHEWTAPIGITSVYCGVPEMIMSNLLPAAMGPLLMQSHIFTAWVWLGLVLFSTTLAHGGYHVPFLFSPEAHDYHHKVFNCWFGTLGLLDKLHGTDKPFAGSVHADRHYVSFSLKPMKEIHPEPLKPARASTSAAGKAAGKAQ